MDRSKYAIILVLVLVAATAVVTAPPIVNGAEAQNNGQRIQPPQRRGPRLSLDQAVSIAVTRSLRMSDRATRDSRRRIQAQVCLLRFLPLPGPFLYRNSRQIPATRHCRRIFCCPRFTAALSPSGRKSTFRKQLSLQNRSLIAPSHFLQRCHSRSTQVESSSTTTSTIGWEWITRRLNTPWTGRILSWRSMKRTTE